MPLSRSPRMDRRRRAIREGLLVSNSESTDDARVSPSRGGRSQVEIPELSKKERGVAYSHSVRRACQHRLVQFIPVRKLSLTGAVAASLVVPVLLMTLHYLVFVSMTLDWAGHPMSSLLNASNPRSLAAWLSSHLWLLCLATTVLTFRLRKHKLDDYDGEYRLWFWLVFTCVIGSIDSTTRLTDLFGAALDRWSQVHIGWTGGAVVQATLATLIGLLGLRLCSELKTVPTSLVLWLFGLVCWAGSAALSQSVLKLDMTPAMRSWMRASLWMGGLTSIWLCGLFYLRAIFMEAQKRFLSRAVMNSNAMPLGQRIRESIPSMPKFSMPGWKRRDLEAEELQTAASSAEPRRRKKRDIEEGSQRESAAPDERRGPTTTRDDQSAPLAKPKRRWGLGGFVLRPPLEAVESAAVGKQPIVSSTNTAANSQANTNPRSPAAHDAEVEKEYGKRSGWFRRGPRNEATADPTGTGDSTGTQSKRADKSAQRQAEQDGPKEKRSLRDRLRWKRKEHPNEEQDDSEVRSKNQTRERGKQRADQSPSEEGATAPKRKWLKLGRPTMPKISMPKISLPKPKLPKLKLPSFRLQPPGASDNADDGDGSANASRVPAVNASRPLPSTSSSNNAARQNNPSNSDEDSDSLRGMSKAERKRLKRMQRDDEGDRRAA